jgi:hypothetical protein
VQRAAGEQVRDAESVTDIKETALKYLHILGILYFSKF